MKIFPSYFLKTLVLLATLLIASLALAKDSTPTLYQAGMVLDLGNGVFEGSTSLAELLKHGNFGLGASEGAPGELVIFDGKAYLGNANGVPSILPNTTKAAFVQVVDFKPTKTFILKNIQSFDDLGKKIDAMTPSKNIFYAVKIEGTFNVIKLRDFPPPTKPYPSLFSWINQHQNIMYPKNISGTMLGFRSPAYTHEIASPGYHLHFIRTDRKLVGHVYDLQADQVNVSIEPIYHFSLMLPTTQAFLNSTLQENTH